MNAATLSLFQQRRSDMTAMLGAVQQGNMGAAQSALTSLQKDNTGLSNTTASTSSNGATKIKADFTALSSAIQSGNLADAQSALKAYQADRSSESGDGSASSSFAKDLSSLVSDVASGNQSSIATDGTALAHDLQSAFGSGTTTAPSGTGSSSDPVSTFVSDLTQLAKDAASGNQTALAADQKALTTDVTNLVGNGQAPGSQGSVAPTGHHHHHHHGGGQVDQGNAAGTSTPSTVQSNDGDGDEASVSPPTPPAQTTSSDPLSSLVGLLESATSSAPTAA